MLCSFTDWIIIANSSNFTQEIFLLIHFFKVYFYALQHLLLLLIQFPEQ